MPVSKKSAKSKKLNPKKQSNGTRIDVIFSGPLLFVPETASGKITALEVFAPANGHHLGALFLPEVIFTDAELDDPKCERWPSPESFSLLDPHSYSVDLVQTGKKLATFPVTSIPATNHKIKPGRRISHDWDVAITVKGALSDWTSHRTAVVTEGLYKGGDAPRVGSTVASLHRLTYPAVTEADIFGAHTEARDYLGTNLSKGGTLIIVGEIPYQSTLLHERKAIEAMARLAGLDLHYTDTNPRPLPTQLMSHVLICGMSTIVAP